MIDRERLIELIDSTGTCGLASIEDCKVCDYSKESNCRTAAVADHLIDNGVTIQKYGRWEIILDEWDCEFAKCSACGGEFYDLEDTIDTLMNYCPNCGAKMDKENTDG